MKTVQRAWQETKPLKTEFSSFRDPSGRVFLHKDQVYRHVHSSYQKQYDALMSTGLYEECVSQKLLVAHTEVDSALFPDDGFDIYKILHPYQIPFISYPYEWCFGQYKDAALATLRLHRQALDKGMILKDASAYNIQFVDGQAMLIDTLSFDFYTEGMVWLAYGQFCRHFLAPLMLMAYRDVRLSQLMRVYIDGIPLDLASRLLNGKGGLAARQHIHWHANATVRHATDGQVGQSTRKIQISKFQHTALIESMIRIVEGLSLKKMQTEWGDYYDHTNYSDSAAQAKERLVDEYISSITPKTVWDFGANNGHFTRIATQHGARAVAFDIDPVAVECNHQEIKKSKEKNLLPLLLDLTNPSPGIGFANHERTTIDTRQHPDCIFALALIHHLAISNNLPLHTIAEWFSTITEHLIIEFVPKEDSQVQKLLATRDDIFPAYTREGFEAAFGSFFQIEQSAPVGDSFRTLYLLKRRMA